MFLLLSTLLLADDWSDLLQLRKSGFFQEEYQGCLSLLKSDSSRKAQCRKRIAYLEGRIDPDGSFACLKTLWEVQQRYAQLEADFRWETVFELQQGETCSVVMHADLILWLIPEGVKQRKEDEALVLLDSLKLDDLTSTQKRKIQRLRVDLLARLGRFEEAKALELESSIPRSARPSEGVHQREKEMRRVFLGEVSRLGVGLFVLVNIPMAIWTIYQRGIGSWRGWWVSLILVGLFAGVSWLYASHSFLVWPSLAVFFLMIQWCTAHAWYADQRVSWICSLIGVVATVSIAWQVLIFFGETSWIY